MLKKFVLYYTYCLSTKHQYILQCEVVPCVLYYSPDVGSFDDFWWAEVWFVSRKKLISVKWKRTATIFIKAEIEIFYKLSPPHHCYVKFYSAKFFTLKILQLLQRLPRLNLANTIRNCFKICEEEANQIVNLMSSLFYASAKVSSYPDFHRIDT